MRYRRIVSAIQKSRRAIDAAILAARVFRGSEIHLVSAVYPVKGRATFTRVRERLENLARAALEEAARALEEEGVHPVKSIVYGKPHRAILKYVSKVGADALAIASASTLTPPPGLIGSTASKLVLRCKRPLLIYTPASPPPPKSIEDIVVVFDRKHAMEELLLTARRLSRDARISLAILAADRVAANREALEASRRTGIRADVLPIKGGSPERLVDVLKGHDLVIVGRHAVIRDLTRLIPFLDRLIGRRSFTDLGLTLLSLSPAPVLVI